MASSVMDRFSFKPVLHRINVLAAAIIVLRANYCTSFLSTSSSSDVWSLSSLSTIPALHATQSPFSSSSFSTESEQETILNLRRASGAQPGQTRSGRTKDEKQREIAGGRLLSSSAAVQVLDFASVKDHTSKAEQALIKAREDYEKRNNRLPYVGVLNSSHTTSTSSNFISGSTTKHSVDTGSSSTLTSRQPNHVDQSPSLMGINEEVIREVGHPIGAFLQRPEDVQDCAAWLRSQAPASHFHGPDAAEKHFSSSEVENFKFILSTSYQESGEVTEAFAKTFYLGTQLMTEDAKRAIWAVYVWCRRTDEIVDAPRESEEEMLRDLSAWEIRLERLWDYGEVVDVLDLPLLHVRIKYPSLSIQPFSDMIRGMLMDIPGLGQDRYESFEELHLYCYRVAGTVGLMSMPIFGCATGFTDDDAKEPALSLGVAFQLTNILRDVGEDASRGRIYLPQEDMAKFNVTEDQIFEKRMDDNYKRLMQYEIARARRYYDRAKRGVRMLSPGSRWPVQASLDCYAQILDKIEANNYDSLHYRAYVSKFEKLCTLPLSWYRTLEISDIFPLPGDAAPIK